MPPIDSARCARQSDPDLNVHFRRAWDEAPDQRRLDRAADAELAHGHVLRAEYLARWAFALREAGR